MGKVFSVEYIRPLLSSSQGTLECDHEVGDSQVPVAVVELLVHCDLFLCNVCDRRQGKDLEIWKAQWEMRRKSRRLGVW